MLFILIISWLSAPICQITGKGSTTVLPEKFMLPPAKRMAMIPHYEDAMLSPKTIKGNACNSVIINRPACLAFINQVQNMTRDDWSLMPQHYTFGNKLMVIFRHRFHLEACHHAHRHPPSMVAPSGAAGRGTAIPLSASACAQQGGQGKTAMSRRR